MAVAAPPPGDVQPAGIPGRDGGRRFSRDGNCVAPESGSGAAITGVDQDGPACRAGLKDGDVVVVFNGKPVEGPNQLASLIHSSAPGSDGDDDGGSRRAEQRNESEAGRLEADGEYAQTSAPMPGMAFVPPPIAPLPPRMYPDVDMPSFTPLSARHGVVVEPSESATVRLLRRPAEQWRAGAFGGEGQSRRGGRD